MTSMTWLGALGAVVLACGCPSSGGASSGGSSGGSSASTAGSGTSGGTTAGTGTGGTSSGSGGSTTGGSTSGTSTGTGGSTGATNVSVTLTNRPDNPGAFSFLVAYQDGTGAWKIAPVPSGDTYTFPITSSAWGVARTCINSAAGAVAGTVDEAHFTISERTSLTATVPPACTDRGQAVAEVDGSIGNGPVGGLRVFFGDRFTDPTDPTVYTIMTPPGTYDLIVAQTLTVPFIADSALVVRGVVVTTSTMRSVDFANAKTLQVLTVTIGGAAGQTKRAQTRLYTVNGTTALLIDKATAPFESRSLAASSMMSGDIYDQIITVATTSSDESTETWTATPAAQVFSAPSALGGAIATVPTSTPYPEAMTSWAAYPNAVGYTWTASQAKAAPQCGGTACSVTWTADLSPGFAGNSPTYQMPDLSGLTGWNTNLQFVSGTLIQGSVRAETSNAGATDFPPAPPAAAGTTRTFAKSSYTVTP